MPSLPFIYIMSWLRRLSRDRSSKGEQDLPMPSRPFSNHVNNMDSQQVQSPPYKDTQYSSGFNSQDKLQSYRPSTAGDQGYNATPRGPGTSAPQGDATNRPTTSATMEPTPDPLTKAFNDAIRPYLEQIDDLKNKLEDTTYQLHQLEDERADMHAWIDKRGLRAGWLILFDVVYQLSLNFPPFSQMSPPPSRTQ